nr:MAG TPA: hypothetical protein [Caudoviricetes sp.]
MEIIRSKRPRRSFQNQTAQANSMLFLLFRQKQITPEIPGTRRKYSVRNRSSPDLT